MGAFTLMKEFSGWTSAHGIPHIGASRNWPVRIIWFIIFLGALGMFGYQMEVIVSTYFDYGVIVATTIAYDKRSFPAVTICNRNAYKNSVVVNNADAAQLLKDYEEAVVSGSVTGVDKFGFNNQTNDDLVKATHAQITMAYLAKQWPDAELADYSYTVDDLILECAFAHHTCSASDFTMIIDPIYGQCYQFNGDPNHVRHVSEAGPEFGLRLLLWSNQSEYMSIVDTATIKVSIHPPSQEPFTDAFGYNMAMGYVNQVAIKQFGNIREQDPYGTCTPTKAGQTFFYDTEEYNMEGCFRSCYQQYIVDQCGCADPRFAKLEEHTWCDYTKLYCVLDLKNEDPPFKITQCDCPQRCTDTTYSAVISQAWWPAQQYSPSTCALWNDHFEWNTTSFEIENTTEEWEACRDNWHDNSMLVQVYFESLISSDLKESPAYTISDIIFNFGGQIGLWMGFSAITMIEFVGLAILIGLACCAKVRGPGKITDADIHHNDMDDIDHIIDKAYDEDDEESIDPYGDSSDDSDDEEEQQPPPIA